MPILGRTPPPVAGDLSRMKLPLRVCSRCCGSSAIAYNTSRATRAAGWAIAPSPATCRGRQPGRSLRLRYQAISSRTTWCGTILAGRNGGPLAGDNRTLDHMEEGWARMAQVTLVRILKEINTLEPEELLQVQQAVQARLAPAGYAPAEEEVLQEMLKVGLLTEIKPRRTDRQGVYPLVPIQGRPLSETIREERR